MQECIINVTKIEELQMINDLSELEKIFTKGERVLVGGGTVILTRKEPNGRNEKFDEFTTLEDFAAYKKGVMKYVR